MVFDETVRCVAQTQSSRTEDDLQMTIKAPREEISQRQAAERTEPVGCPNKESCRVVWTGN